MKNFDLTEGNIVKKIVLFSIPLLAGNLFQQLYNTVDSYVVGNYVDRFALAAVGASTPIINILIGTFMGISTGAGVIIAQYYGGRNIENMRRAVHSSMVITLAMAVVLTFIGVTLTNPLLRMIGVPEDVFPSSSSYLSIYFGGITFTLIYNMGAGILRAVGDSKKPLYFLMMSSVLNIGLDFLFVKGFGWGVEGAAGATLISQAVSALMVCFVLFRTREPYHIRLKELKFDPVIGRNMIALGIPAGLQQGIIPLSNVIVQSYINRFGSSVMAGYSVALRIDGFVLLPLQAFNLAITTFTGQNMGAGKFDRMKKGAYITWLMATGTIGIFVLFMYRYGIPFIRMFSKEEEVVAAGWLTLSTFLPFYLIMPVNQVVNGVLRGSGNAKTPMYIMVFNFVVLRQLYLFVITKMTDSLRFVFFGWPLTWITCAVMSLICFYRSDWIKRKTQP